MSTLRQETIVESKGEDALERMVERVLHHKPPEPAPEPVKEDEPATDDAAAGDSPAEESDAEVVAPIAGDD